jgi:type I restriction enzyme S subunit
VTLPHGWIEAKLGELSSKIGSGATPRGGREAYGAKGTPLIRSMNVHFDGFRLDGLAFLDDSQAKALANVVVEANDVLLNITGASIGRVCLAPDGMAGARVNQHVCIIRLIEAEQRFIQAFLAAPDMQRFVLEENYGLTRQALTKGMIEDIVVPLPPLAEQRRIVAKLDALTARLARARAELDRVITLAGKLHRSVHRPIGEVREAQNVSSLASVISKLRTGPFGSSVHKHDYIGGGTPLINPMHINDGRIVPSYEVSVGSAKTAELSDFKLAAGDVIIGRRGEMGRCAVVQQDQAGWLIGTGSMALTPNEAVSSDYLQLFLSSPPTVEALNANSVGSTMVNLNQSILIALPIRLPNRAEQDRLVTEARSAFARADRLEAEAARARALLDRLESKLLAKAFRGELVPQDPSDEPAQTLLDRIRTQRAAAPQTKRGRKAKVAA